MTSHVSHMEEFDVSNPAGWEEYAERLEFYFAANGIRDAQKKLAVLCSVCGPKTYSVIRSLTSPQSPASMSFTEVMKLLQEHFAPKPSEIYCRFQYQRRFQQQGEGIANYVAELRRLAQHCNFGETLESRLRDQLVCGLRDEMLQKQLLSIKDLTLATAIDRAVSAEAAVAQVMEMRAPTTVESYDVKRLAGSSNSRNNSQRTRRRRSMETIAQPCKPCHRCGGQHSPRTCRFKSAVCNYCKKVGHIERACRAKQQTNRASRGAATGDRNEMNCLSAKLEEYRINKTVCHALNSLTSPVPRALVKLNGITVEMEVDSGAAFTVLSEYTFNKVAWGKQAQLEAFPQRLQDFQGRKIHVLGTASVLVEYGTYHGRLMVLVVKGQRCSLLGRNWFKPLGIRLAGVYQLNSGPIEALLDEYCDLFSENISAVKVPPVTLHIDEKVAPIQMSARKVPFALRDRISEELDRLVRQGILEPVEYTDWATPIVPVIKEDGGIRICGDYKCTVNKALKKDLYQIPAVNDIMTTLKKGKIFAKLDFAQAYQQLPVDEASAKLQTIITHKGAFKPKRLQFGIASAPGIFQKFMDALLGNMDGVIPYFDDVLVVAGSVRELVKVLKEVFERLRRVGIRLKKRKCVFGSDSVTFLGYRIDAQGIHPTAEKVDAIHNAARPRNKPELQAFLGLLNFYHNFLANKAEIVEPLHRLLDKGSSWNWTQEHEKAFQKAKRLISSNSVLIQYDDNLPLTLTCDASPYGIGCVLAHKLPNGKEAPIAFHSRTLAAAERNYAQIDKEALSIIAGIKKFHNYLYGRSFEVKTDHKPLLGLLGKSVQTPAGLSPRMTRWSIMLSAYDYNLVYVPGKQIGNADALSRLPQPGNVAEVPPPLEVLLLESMPDPPLTAKEIAEMTSKDPVLSKVRNWVANGWPSNVNSDELKVFWRRKNELSIHKDCVLRGCCVVVPPQLRRRTLELLHNGHPGIVRMKCLARSYVWWPKVGHEIEALVRSCSQCQESRKDPQKECGGTWPEAKAPWSRVHADFFGPFHGKIFLLVVDAFSKWLEVRIVPSTSSRAAIEVLRELFATHGLPDCIVTDNGTAFKSVEFSRFLKSNHIRHVTSAPFHPASNGQAERSVQTAKEFLQKDSSGDWSVRIARLLLTQHATPSPTTSVSPAELLMNRKLVTCLDRLKPHSHNSFQVDRSPPRKQFEVNDPVFARLYGRTQKWARATITGKLGRVLYIVSTADGLILKRHVNQLRPRSTHECSSKKGGRKCYIRSLLTV
ncbi:hypothetical protein M513_12023, partial [Trichuris suis]